jgi:hypothetical protein
MTTSTGKNPNSKRQAKRQAEILDEYLRKVDGPGRWNRAGVFVDCRECENRVFVDTYQEPRCPKCGRLFKWLQRMRNEGRRKEKRNG